MGRVTVFALAWLAAGGLVAPAFAADPSVEPFGMLRPLPADTFMTAPRRAALAGAYDVAATDTKAYDPGGIFDEVRTGLSESWQDNDKGSEHRGPFVTGEVLFHPIPGSYRNGFLEFFLKPRPHVGASVSTAGGTDQIFGGVTWTVPLPPFGFLEASFGGTVHDGSLYTPPDQRGLSLGCYTLFRESVGLGINMGPHVRVIGAIDHSSHANLCGQHNNGLTHIGFSLGYKF